MKNILVLENNETISTMVRNIFKSDEYRILFPVRSSIEQKDSKLPEQIPDLVIADLSSIKNETAELLIQIKNNPVTSLVPFLLIMPGAFSTEDGSKSEGHSSLQKELDEVSRAINLCEMERAQKNPYYS